ncbi:MAG TPA: hypothetical protein VLD67_15395 [Vicinamibacterales bacterium]|nr:hypothetical protein [Vicinamibacterales bacterium]
MRKFLIAAGGGLVVATLAFACGGGSGNPSTPSTPGATALSVNILGDRGNQSFSPNPGQDNGTALVVWRNMDNQVHRIVGNEGAFDTGNVNPGASSSNIRIPADGTNYHCSLHPGMIGTIRTTAGTAPTCTGQYC